MNQQLYPTNMTEALTQWEATAREGNADAQYKLGIMYAKAPDVEWDFEKAYDWLLKAANQGHAEAQNHLGWMFSHAQGVPQDNAEAVKWFRLAAEQNNAAAQNNLGWMLQNGHGCEPDDLEAITLYRKSADQNCPRGQLHYGLMLRAGRGIKKDVGEAFDWLCKASNNGDADAAYELGRMCDGAYDGQPNRDFAIIFHTRAAQRGHAAAKARLQQLESFNGADPDSMQCVILPNGETIEGNGETYPRLIAEHIRSVTTDDERVLLVNELTRFYTESARARTAEQNWIELINCIEDPEKRAYTLLDTGCRLEKCKDWAEAIRIYQESISLEPTDQQTLYFAHNNLGFCLIQVGRFAEGENYSRKAIKIDGARSNAYKNTGLALQGQGRFVEAAELFIAGTLTRPQDRRSFDHLETLLRTHPEIREQMPTIDADIEKCCETVEMENQAAWNAVRQTYRERPNNARPCFEFTPENLAQLLPLAKVTAIDADNIIVESRLGESLPAFRIRVTRSQKYAPTEEQLKSEFDKELGQPDGWFSGLPSDAQERYAAIYFLRGRTSFDSASEDAVIWLADLRSNKAVALSDRVPAKLVLAGLDTLYHEYFHVMMEMLRRVGAMPDDYVQEMAGRYPPRSARTELFNEEYAAEAYAGYAMKEPPGSNSEPWRFGS